MLSLQVHLASPLIGMPTTTKIPVYLTVYIQIEDSKMCAICKTVKHLVCEKCYMYAVVGEQFKVREVLYVCCSGRAAV